MPDVFCHRQEAELAVDISTVEGALTDGVKTHPVDDLAGLGAAGDVRDDDAGGPGLEGADVVAVAAAPDADQRVDVVDAGGADLVFQADPIIGHVLGAQPDGIDAAETGDLDDAGLGEIYFKDIRELLLAKKLQDSAGTCAHDNRV